MPLTPAHAAAALPLHAAARRLRLALPLSALVIGTMTPDFEYLLRLRPQGRFGHSMLGLVTFCLPVGLAAWLLFEVLVAPALLRLLPPGLAAAIRNDAARASGGRLVLCAAIAVVLGALSHDLWDAFTHPGGGVVALFPVLGERVAPTLVPRLRWYTVLQHGSTVLGLVTICAATARWVIRQSPEARRFAPGQALQSLGVSAALLGTATLGAVANATRGPAGGAMQALGFAAVGGMAALVLALLAYGLISRTE